MTEFIIHNPVKKDTHYLCRITTTKKHAVKLRIPYSIIKHAMLLSNKNGHLLDIQVPENDFAMEYILKMESACIDKLINENSNWFNNALDRCNIPSLLESCVHKNNCLQLYSSNIRSSAVFNGDIISVTEWLSNNPVEVSLTIICDGMVIYPKRFGIRWVISEITQYDNQCDEMIPDVGELESFWKNYSTQYLKELLDEKEKLDKKISEVKNIVESFGNNDINDLESNIEKLKTSMNEGHFYKNILSEIGIV